jgi:hypothetical protein
MGKGNTRLQKFRIDIIEIDSLRSRKMKVSCQLKVYKGTTCNCIGAQ